MYKIIGSKQLSKKGFTLVEIMVATGVFLVSMSGILFSYLKCMELQDIGRNVSIATQAVQNKMEDVKATTFANIYSTFNNQTFTAANLNGKGVVYVNNSNPSLLLIKIVFCWKQPNGRLFGEDKNLNGVLDAGEDANANGQLDSYVQISSYIYG